MDKSFKSSVELLGEYHVLRRTGALLLFCISYYLAFQIGSTLYLSGAKMPTFMPANGLVLAILLLQSKKIWPTILLLQGMLHFWLNFQLLGNSMTFTVLATVSVTLSVLLAAIIVRHFHKGEITLTQLSMGLLFLGAIIVGTSIGATIGAVALSQAYANTSYWSSWQSWMCSDMIGELLIVPAIVGLSSIRLSHFKKLSIPRVIEAAVLIVALGYVATSVFLSQADQMQTILDYPMIIVPVLLWAAIRYHPRFVALAILLIGLLVVYQAHRGDGPLVAQNLITSQLVLTIQVYLFVISVPILSTALLLEGQKGVEQELANSKALLNSIVSSVPDVIYRLDLEGNIVFVNEAIEAYGYTVSELIGSSIIDLVYPDDRALLTNRLVERRAGDRRTKNLEIRLLAKNAEIVPTEIRSNLPEVLIDAVGLYATDEAGDRNFIGSQGTIRDITERKKTEAALTRSEGKYRNLYKKTPMMLQGLDRDRNIISVSDQWLNVLGYELEEVIGHNLVEFLSPATRKYSEEVVYPSFMKHGFITDQPYQYIKKNGDIIDLVMSSISELDSDDNFLQSHDVLIDVTEQKKLEAQVQHALKMEAVGRLAGGVAHDFNNLLTAIIGHGELALMSLHKDDDVRGDIQEIIDTAERAAAVTRQLLTFSRKQVVNIQSIDINDTIHSMGKMLNRLLSEDVQLSLELANDIGLIEADQSQLEQVIVNLAVNARDAMPSGGRLHIQTTRVDLEEGHIDRPYELSSGTFLKLCISDTGVGMTPEIQEHIFEPFFTTKDASSGTGLGLATIYAIVEQAGGFITVYSEEGLGTTFNIYIPISENTELVEKVQATKEVDPSGTETILVVEDNEGILNVINIILKQCGYTVLTAENADAGIEQFNAHPEIDIIVTDVIMPGLSGPDLVKHLEGLEYTNPVLYMSGHNEEMIVDRGVLKPGIDFISKPFHPLDLARKVREILDLQAAQSA